MLLSYAQNHQISENTLPCIRRAVLHDVLLGRVGLDQVFPSVKTGPFQVLLLRAYFPDQNLDAARLAEQFHITGHSELLTDFIPIGDNLALLLCSDAAIHIHNEFIKLQNQHDSAIYRALRFPYSVFLTYGRVVDNANDIPASYHDALNLQQHSFFCEQEQHLLCLDEMSDRASRLPAINALLTEKYADRLMQSMQAFNRDLTYATFFELEDVLVAGSDSPEDIRLFYADLYLQIKEQMRYLYPGHTIPFYSNSHIIKTIMEAPRLSDITHFLVQRFDMIMAYIGASSQESVLGSILHYIQHNYASNITLENIAPLFGYNHSYLGKIFHKKTGYSFTEYIDRLRIDRAKELLLQDNSKVYLIAKQVGYKNVDYFHIKFRKYVNMSPVEFRKTHSDLSHSHIKENVEKGSLFHA